MAEGGIAAALANVDDRDNWKVHFADTMRGGQYVNNWRMAELHAKEAPDRVRELEAWGALFDRTQGRPHPAAQLRRPPLPAPRPRRRPHRPGDDPHPAGPRHPPGHRRPHGVHGRPRCSKDGDRVAGAFGYDRERGRFRVLRRPRPSCSPPAASAGPTRSPATAGSTPATATPSPTTRAPSCIDMEFVQFHPTGMVWPPSVRGILVTEGVRGEGGVLRNSKGRRFMFDDIPDNYKSADRRQRGGGLALLPGRQERPPPARAAHARPRGPLHRARGARRAAAARTAASSSTSPGSRSSMPNAAEHIKKKLPSMYHQFKQLADIDITKEPMEVGPTTHYVMGGVRVTPTPRCRRVPGLFAAGECAAGINGANRLGGNSLSDLLVFGKRAGEYAAQFAKEQRRRPRRRRARSRRRRRAGRSSRSSAATARREPVPDPARPAGR